MNRYTAASLATLMLLQPALAQGGKEAISLSPLSHLISPPHPVPQRSGVTGRQLKEAASKAYPRTHFQKALYFKQKGEINSALIEFLKATQEDPRLVRAFYEQALIFQERGYLKLAESSLEQALAVQPGYQQARLLLAGVRLEQGKLQEAATDLGRSIDVAMAQPKVESPPPDASTPELPPAIPDSQAATQMSAPATAETAPAQEAPSADTASSGANASALPVEAPAAADDAHQAGPLDDLLKGIPGVDPSVSENPQPIPEKPHNAPDVVASAKPGDITTKTVTQAENLSSLIKQRPDKQPGFHFGNPFRFWMQEPKPKIWKSPKVVVPVKGQKPAKVPPFPKKYLSKNTLPLFPKEDKNQAPGWFSWLFKSRETGKPEAPEKGRNPNPKPKASNQPDIAQALKEQQERLNEAIAMVLRQPSVMPPPQELQVPSEKPPVVSLTVHDRKPVPDKPAPPPVAPEAPVILSESPSLPPEKPQPAPQKPAATPAPSEKEDTPILVFASPIRTPTASAARPPAAQPPETHMAPARPALIVLPPQPHLQPAVTPAPVPVRRSAAPPVVSEFIEPLNAAPPAVPVPAAPPPAKPAPPVVEHAQQSLVPFKPGKPVKSGPAFRSPPLPSTQLSWLSAAQSQKAPPSPQPAKAPTQAEDPWTVRMRYLVEHGTSSLKPGEAFMFSEETGEGVLFLPEGKTVRRQVAAPRDAQEVAAQRRPDILVPQELMYNLSLLGKLLPKQDTSAPRESGDDGFSLDQLLTKPDGLWSWVKNRFKM